MSKKFTNSILSMTDVKELKQIANSYGIAYSPNIGIETLRTRILDFVQDPTKVNDIDPKQIQEEEVTKATKGKEKTKKKKKSKSKKVSKVPEDTGNLAEQLTRAEDIREKKKAKKAAKKKKKAEKEAYLAKVKEAEIQLANNRNVYDIINETEAEKANRIRKAAIKKYRVQITVYDPDKQKLHGEVIRGRNRYSGPIGQMVNYNGLPQHIHHIILNILKERKYKRVYETEINGIKQNTYALEDAYGINYLPDLTQEELDELAQLQAANSLIA